MQNNLEKNFERSKQRDIELDERLETYNFQINAIYWQTGMVILLTLMAISVGIRTAIGFIVYLGTVAGAVIMVLLISHFSIKTRNRVIARGLGIEYPQYEYFIKLKKHGEDSGTYLENVIKQSHLKEAIRKKERKTKVYLLVKLGKLENQKGINREQFAKLAEKYKFPKSRYDMDIPQLDSMIKVISALPSKPKKNNGPDE